MNKIINKYVIFKNKFYRKMKQKFNILKFKYCAKKWLMVKNGIIIKLYVPNF